MGVDDEDLADEVLLAGGHAGPALAAAALRPVGRQRHPFDVAGVRDGDDHLLALDQVLDVVLELDLLDLGAARGREFLLHLLKFAAQDLQKALPGAEDLEISGDLLDERLQVLDDLVALEPGQAMEPELQYRLRLLFRQAVGAVLKALFRLVDHADQRLHLAGRPRRLPERGPRGRRIGSLADQRDHRIQVDHGDGEAEQDVGARPRLVEFEYRAPGDDLLAEVDKEGDDVLEIHHLRLAAVQGQHVDAEAGLQWRVTVELVQHHLGDDIAPDLDHHADAVAIGLVAQIDDALDGLIPNQLGDALDHPRLVDLIRDLGDDDGLAILADLLDFGASAHDDGATTGVIRFMDARSAEYDAGGREVRPRQVLHQLVDGDLGIVHVGTAGVDHLAQVVGRDVGRHADGDTAGAVDQQVGKPGRQHGGLLGVAVVTGLEVDRALVEILENRLGRAGEPRLGVTHGGRRVAVHGAEIALPFDEHEPHGEILGHAHHGVVDGGVAVGVVLAHDVADDARRLAERLGPVVAALLHGVKDAAVDRLQSVAHVGQCAGHDHAHGVVEVGVLHLLLEAHDRDVVFRRCGRRGQPILLRISRECGASARSTGCTKSVPLNLADFAPANNKMAELAGRRAPPISQDG